VRVHYEGWNRFFLEQGDGKRDPRNRSGEARNPVRTFPSKKLGEGKRKKGFQKGGVRNLLWGGLSYHSATRRHFIKGETREGIRTRPLIEGKNRTSCDDIYHKAWIQGQMGPGGYCVGNENKPPRRSGKGKRGKAWRKGEEERTFDDKGHYLLPRDRITSSLKKAQGA